jgi:membrane-bound metal-dependent hydrolase YbcI (DUF457 family)
MYIGHVGAALAAKRVRVSIGLLPLLIATYAPDWVDSGMCLAGAYDPYGMLSHSVPAVLFLALLGFTWSAWATRDWTGGLVIAAVVVSHMLLDWITGYKPTWPGGPMIGLQLYEHPVADFAAEGLVILVGALLYARTVSRRQRPWTDFSIMFGALLVLQLSIDVAHLLLKSLPKC